MPALLRFEWNIVGLQLAAQDRLPCRLRARLMPSGRELVQGPPKAVWTPQIDPLGEGQPVIAISHGLIPVCYPCRNQYAQMAGYARVNG
jgi:hypothetical protein